MSVNITVNGKFEKHCRSHPLLSDPQEVKKAEEKERRKLRLLQVREESKQIAKRIRDAVNKEKKRELKKLQATKERELECWRQNALRSKYEDYRDAIYQIGTAHQAAKRENYEREAKQKKQSSYKDFKKQIAARKSQPGKNNATKQYVCTCQETLPGTSNQFKCTCTKTNEPSTKSKAESHKRKRDVSSSSNQSESDDEFSKDKTTLSLSSTTDSSSFSAFDNEASKSSVSVPNKNKCLIKTPAIYVDVEVGSDDSIIINAPAETKNRNVEYNRKFNSVIRLSPRKASAQKESTHEIASITTSTSEVVLEEKHEKKSTSENENKQLKKTQVSKEKRFTVISDLVKKQQANDAITQTKRPVPSSPRKSVTSGTTTSPTKQSKEVSFRPSASRSPPQSPRKTSATSKTVTTQPLTSLASTAKGSTGASSSGCVQVYDYNTKFTKQQDRSAAVARVERHRDESQPSAMEQAELENQKEKEKQLEILKKIQVVEERGQKAIEREQIRRDCNFLTEKLEALTREYANHLPTNDNQPHIFADKQLRKEGKMNSAIEKLLQRPNIITCSEQSQPIIIDEQVHKPSKNVENSPNFLNVASLNSKPLQTDDVSNDSCCSILLGYVDDQSRLIKQDLKNIDANQNQSKLKRLKDLLKRLDQLRNALLEELRNEREYKTENRGNEKTRLSPRSDNIKQVIDDICKMRKEHEELLIDEETPEPKSLTEREKELQAKEILLDKKVREFYELQKQKNYSKKIATKKNLKRIVNKEKAAKDHASSSSDENNDTNDTAKGSDDVIYASGENPLEIVITVKGEAKIVKKAPKPKRKHFPERGASKLSTIIRSPQSSASTTKKKIQAKKALELQNISKKRNSFDSNSTSYISLPPEIPTCIEALAKQLSDCHHKGIKKTLSGEHATATQKEPNESENSIESTSNSSRLKSKPRINPLIAQYIQQLLGMSKNSLEKLSVSSSDVETPGSSTINTTENAAEIDSLCTEERLRSLQRFIEDNKSFVKDLEQSINSQNSTSLENSLKIVDDIWRKRLRKSSAEVAKNKKIQVAKEKMQTHKDDKNGNAEKKSLENKEKKPNKSKSMKQITKTTQTNGNKKLESKTISTVETADKAIDAKLPLDNSKKEPDAQISRYAKLTENCTHRIAELTELINRVREEKQRLLEVTLSSVSDNDRHSNEHAARAEGKTSTGYKKDDITLVNSCSEESIQNGDSSSSETLQEMPKLTWADKNKQIANSCDSGIAESRPITALENRVDQEPVSHTSESTTTQEVRKAKPPPTLNRFSPQLPEEELPHELSTIFEVDTPATSRINTAIAQSTNEKEKTLNTAPKVPQPVLFPAFEEYIKKLGVDLSGLRPEESLLLQHEFASFLECMQKNCSSNEFPTIDNYIRYFCKDEFHLSDTIEDCLTKLCLMNKSPRKFPTIREYIKKNASKSLTGEPQLLDTTSLENSSDTDSLDIEKELKKRNILKNPFRVIDDKGQNQEYISPGESGVHKLSTSTTNTDNSMESELGRLIKESRMELRRKPKSTNILSSTTTSTNVSALANAALKSLENDSKGKGRVFNFRDFLTRELEKHANTSSSTANNSNDESLRNQFLNSLIGRLTPRARGASNKSGAPTLDRLKTSTPVGMQVTQTNTVSSSDSAGRIFSCESHLSSVSYDL